MEKIQRTFVRQEAYLKIRNWILDGTLAQGAQIRDKELAEQLGVSRTPIREAILRLEDEGFIQTKPNSATFVSSIDFQNALSLYTIVWTLERLALTQAFTSITQFQIQTMREINEVFLQKIKENDRLAALQADYDFHSIFVNLARNVELEKIISELKQKLKRLDLFYFSKIKDAARSYDEHLDIINALQNKDLPLALNAIEDNWKNSFTRFQI